MGLLDSTAAALFDFPEKRGECRLDLNGGLTGKIEVIQTHTSKLKVRASVSITLLISFPFTFNSLKAAEAIVCGNNEGPLKVENLIC